MHMCFFTHLSKGCVELNHINIFILQQQKKTQLLPQCLLVSLSDLKIDLQIKTNNQTLSENATYRITKSWTSDVLFPKDIPQENFNISVFVKEG